MIKHTMTSALVLLLMGACDATSGEEGLSDLDSLDAALSSEVEFQEESEHEVRRRCARAMGRRADRADRDDFEARPDRARGKRGRRLCRIARVHRLLENHADPDALAACREQRAECVQSDDRQACRPDVRACYQPLIEDARAKVCEEHLAACEAGQAPERVCEHVEARCDG